MSSLASAGGFQVMRTLSLVKGSTAAFTGPGLPAVSGEGGRGEGGGRGHIQD